MKSPIIMPINYPIYYIGNIEHPIVFLLSFIVAFLILVVFTDPIISFLEFLSGLIHLDFWWRCKECYRKVSPFSSNPCKYCLQEKQEAIKKAQADAETIIINQSERLRIRELEVCEHQKYIGELFDKIEKASGNLHSRPEYFQEFKRQNLESNKTFDLTKPSSADLNYIHYPIIKPLYFYIPY